MITRRAILIVLDGVGVGALPDALEYNGVVGCNSIKNVAKVLRGLDIPYLGKLGLGVIEKIKGIDPTLWSYCTMIGKIAPLTKANDSVPLHWEMMGILSESFPLYENGLPKEIIKRAERETGYQFVGNITVTKPNQLEMLRIKHIKTGKPAIYCTNDSVVQIIAIPKILPLDELYRITEIVRQVLTGEHGVLRVVAKPFTLKDGIFLRLEHLRKDYTLPPPTEGNILFPLLEKGIPLIAVGKISDFFMNVPFTKAFKGKCNEDHLKAILNSLRDEEEKFIFANLLDFDTMGHSKDIKGYAMKLEEFDSYIPDIISSMNDNDLLIITGDHGCDPTIESVKTHTREYVPLIMYNKKTTRRFNLGMCKSYTLIASTLSFYYGLRSSKCYQENILKTYLGDIVK